MTRQLNRSTLIIKYKSMQTPVLQKKDIHVLDYSTNKPTHNSYLDETPIGIFAHSSRTKAYSSLGYLGFCTATPFFQWDLKPETEMTNQGHSRTNL